MRPALYDGGRQVFPCESSSHNDATQIQWRKSRSVHEKDRYMGLIGGDYNGFVMIVSVTVTILVATVGRRALRFERLLSSAAVEITEDSSVAPTSAVRRTTIRWIVTCLVAWIGVAIVVDWGLIFGTEQLARQAVPMIAFTFACVTLCLAVFLLRRLRPARLRARRQGKTGIDADVSPGGKRSLSLALIGIASLIGGFGLMIAFGDFGRLGQPDVATTVAIVVNVYVFVVVELVALGAGIGSRRTVSGKLGMLASGVLLLLLGVPMVVGIVDSMLERQSDESSCPWFQAPIGITALVLLVLATRRFAEFERSLRGADDRPVAPGPAGRRGEMTTGRLMAITAGVALILGLFRAILSLDDDLPWLFAWGFLVINLLVSLAMFGVALLLDQRLRRALDRVRMPINDLDIARPLERSPQ